MTHKRIEDAKRDTLMYMSASSVWTGRSSLPSSRNQETARSLRDSPSHSQSARVAAHTAPAANSRERFMSLPAHREQRSHDDGHLGKGPGDVSMGSAASVRSLAREEASEPPQSDINKRLEDLLASLPIRKRRVNMQLADRVNKPPSLAGVAAGEICCFATQRQHSHPSTVHPL